MRPYDEAATCEKCGGTDISTQYHRATLPADNGGYDCRLNEPCHWRVCEKHIARFCRRCSWQWTEGVVARADRAMRRKVKP